MRDPYEVLGVDRKASAADIKSAFRRLAKKLHPDANKNDPNAASRFAEINAAYEILGEDDKRKAFDRGEIDAEGKPRFQGFDRFGAGAQPGRRFWPGSGLSRLSASARRALPGPPGAAAVAAVLAALRISCEKLSAAWAGRAAAAPELPSRPRISAARRRCHGGADSHAAGCGAWRYPAHTAAVRQGC